MDDLEKQIADLRREISEKNAQKDQLENLLQQQRYQAHLDYCKKVERAAEAMLPLVEKHVCGRDDFSWTWDPAEPCLRCHLLHVVNQGAWDPEWELTLEMRKWQ